MNLPTQTLQFGHCLFNIWGRNWKYFYDLPENEAYRNSANYFKAPIPIPNRIELLRYIPTNGIIAEVGVLYGEYAKHIISVCQPKELHLIDLWEKQPADQYYEPALDFISRKEWERIYSNLKEEYQENQRVKLHKKDSTLACESFPDNYFDFVYIDANHSTKACLSDLNLWFRTVKINGYIGGHDFDITAKHMVDAVHQFATSHDVSWEFVTIDRPESYLFKKLG